MRKNGDGLLTETSNNNGGQNNNLRAGPTGL